MLDAFLRWFFFRFHKELLSFGEHIRRRDAGLEVGEGPAHSFLGKETARSLRNIQEIKEKQPKGNNLSSRKATPKASCRFSDQKGC